MKTWNSKYLFILLFTILSAPVFGNSGEGGKNPNQNNRKLRYDFLHSRNDGSESLNNRIYVDFQFLGVGFEYLHIIHNRLSLGVKLGLGSQKNFWITHPSFGSNGGAFFNERYSGGLLLHFSKSEKLQLEAGFKKIGYIWSDGELVIANALNLAVFTGWKKVQIGVNINIGENKWDNMSYGSLLVFRFPLKNW